MALKQGRLGSIPDAIQYDDAVHSTSIEVDDPVRVNAVPVAGGDVLRLGDLPSDPAELVYSGANVADNAVVRGDGGTRKVQGSSVTISDSGSISLPAGETVDGVDISVHAADPDAHHAQLHNAASHSDIASSGANIDDAVSKRHTQGTDTSIGSLSVYANNAAAVSGGLAVGDLYRNGADPDLVCVVH